MDFFKIDEWGSQQEEGGRVRTWLWLCAFGLSLASGACIASTEPSTVGTHTNWLELCSRDAQCGEGRCIDYVCTLQCDPGGRDCAPLGPKAECTLKDTQGDTFCDLPCSADDQCNGVGEDLVCSDGACRTRGLPVTMSKALDAVFQAPKMEGDDSRTYNQPIAAAWVEDHWRVAREVLEETADEWAGELKAVDLWQDGSMTRKSTRLQVEGTAAPFITVVGPLADAVEVSTDGGDTSEECETRQLDAALETYLRLPCVADWFAIAGSQDLLGVDHDEGTVTLGRYRQAEGRWVIPQTEVWWSDGLVTPFRRGEDLWLLDQAAPPPGVLRSSTIYRFAGALGKKVKAFSEPSNLTDIGVEPVDEDSFEGIFFWQPDEEGWFTPYREVVMRTQSSETSYVEHPSEFYARSQAAHGALSAPVRFDVGSESGTERLGWTPVPEKDLLAFCHVDEGPDASSRLMLSLFDVRGRLVAPPRELEADDADQIWECTLHCSGTEVLATWEYNMEVSPGGLSTRPGGGAVHAQVVRLD